ncbi:hypothetical protein JCM13664_18230 [Methylothermus subterraneus]
MAALTPQRERDWPLWLAGLLSGTLGTLSVLALVVKLNLAAKFPERADLTRPTLLELAPPPPKAQAKPKPKPRRPPPTKRLQPIPAPDLGAALSGIDLGLPEAAFELGTDQHLLGETANDEEAIDTPPQPVATFSFTYPPQAKKANLQGYVLLAVQVDEQGRVIEAQVLESSPPGVFEQSALEGIRRWRFSPARAKGKPVAAWVQQKIVFQLG